MDIEQLKLVLEAEKGVSGDAQSVAILWIIVDSILPVVAWVSVFFIGCTKIALPLIDAIFEESLLCKFRDELDIGSTGQLTQSERKATTSKIFELIENSKKR